MFDIHIGTLIPAEHAPEMIAQLNPLGFECYELTFSGKHPGAYAAGELEKLAERTLRALDGREISALGLYANPLTEAEDAADVKRLLDACALFECGVIGAFAGGIPEKTVPETIPAFKAFWEPMADYAGERGLKIGFEGCGNGWYGGSHNIAYCPEAWELMFDAVPEKSLGLEWEPCHALEALADPIPQLRRWADRVVHLHGKDATIAWDIIRDYGINNIHHYCWNRTPGFGDTNWSDIFTILLQAGFEGACDIEGYHDPVHFSDMEWTAQKTSVDYLKRCRGGLEYIEGPNEYRGYQGARKK